MPKNQGAIPTHEGAAGTPDLQMFDPNKKPKKTCMKKCGSRKNKKVSFKNQNEVRVYDEKAAVGKNDAHVDCFFRQEGKISRAITVTAQQIGKGNQQVALDDLKKAAKVSGFRGYKQPRKVEQKRNNVVTTLPQKPSQAQFSVRSGVRKVTRQQNVASVRSNAVQTQTRKVEQKRNNVVTTLPQKPSQTRFSVRSGVRKVTQPQNVAPMRSNAAQPQTRNNVARKPYVVPAGLPSVLQKYMPRKVR